MRFEKSENKPYCVDGRHHSKKTNIDGDRTSLG